MIDENSNLSDAILLVQQRNDFYKKKFFLMLGVFLLCLLVISILTAILIYIQSQAAKPKYFVADELGRLIQDIPLSQPNMPLEDVIAWTVEGVERANSFDFVNYRQQLQDAQKYFTNTSWATYMHELTISDNLLALKNRRWVFVAKVVEKPTLITEGVLSGVRAYKLQMPLLVTYLKPPIYDAKSSTTNAFIVTVIVLRKNLLESYKGLAIYSMVIQNAPQNAIRPMVIPQ